MAAMDWDWDDLGDWITWAVLVFLFLATLLTALMFLAFLVSHAITFFHFRRGRRSSNAGNKPPSMAYSYKELPPAPHAQDSRERDSCAICVAPYKSGDTCSVLPGCAHMFHKPCVASWLGKKNTCPLCRATVILPAAAAPRQQGNAADDMV
ncbi:unnamed protein product [Urochloa decumbens]|uniref:RING-type domain-containing protein n=1 Tax=Urochloa decumbens TaxID=240449 RepID=A0ABC9B8U2_9POAL